MATVVVQQQTLRHSTPPPSPIPPALTVNRRPSPSRPASPVLTSDQPSSLLYPPDNFMRISQAPSPPIYAIDATTLAEAMDHMASQPLPDPALMFPWLHGLHPENQLQLGFFSCRKRALRRTPKCWRSITVVKLGGDLGKARLKGAVSASEVITPASRFFLADPPEGFSVRNFQIQTAKVAPVSDIVIYGEDGANKADLLDLAEQFAMAQHAWRLKIDPTQERPAYHTFVVTSPFSEIEKEHPELVAVDSGGQITGRVMDFCQWERLEMCSMSKASEISGNVWLGPTPDYMLRPGLPEPPQTTYDLLIEASDLASIPGPRLLAMIDKDLDHGPQRMDFPSSGSIVLPSGNTREVEDFVNTVRWIYYLAHPDGPADDADHEGDAAMASPCRKPRRVFIHCADGYTESSLLAIAYFMFAEGVPAHEAWLKLHCDKQRNFFAYPTDVAFLMHIQGRLLQESPAAQSLDLTDMWDPNWFLRMDGSFPSRILPYLYLGNLAHANNPDLLWELGIRRVLSIGEPVNWSHTDRVKFGQQNLMYIDNVQDNGIDPLCREFNRCLEFTGRGKNDGMATLVHCRVGVSRSASICIAEAMASKGLSFPRAYSFVRARRLNVIIQPHLRFVYELLQLEEFQLQQRNKPMKKELEWSTVAREIALLNKPYTRG
ncbi:hypothetical protein NUU61_003955 [Penicillium alfredii]|uniref:Uncharacterized protein n=1 Tax=Penicillium alfredii TaxID=1506179 RepID=A0A9W9FKD8_9EURO|nr:uncharacterized protein NUU61_003955 [Penicillium alfredii]KAJ5101733.1 hypothetical protein NUU61_003955 [Penicillium alfredii]